jgi:hypothetical protein
MSRLANQVGHSVVMVTPQGLGRMRGDVDTQLMISYLLNAMCCRHMIRLEFDQTNQEACLPGEKACDLYAQRQGVLEQAAQQVTIRRGFPPQ